MKVRLTDEEVIREYLPTKPDQCFEALYTRYVNKVYRRCLSMTKDSLQAEDFTQDIFLKVFNKLDAFQQRSSFSTWLYSIAYNYCSDQLRMAKRIQFGSIESDYEYDESERESAQLHEDSLQLVNIAIGKLSDNERTLLELKYEEGLSIDEIAEQYNLKPSAVKMRLKRTREKVQQLCGQYQA
ncbi:RNA polymerase sigma factor [Spirosoma daeguense]